ncbi:MAG: T9SS type A sorting domain-containing protein [Bacteroidales bacterium]|nr:T9SS type A sorting domain-containing protein [Bacteroidales bacterium]
MKKSKILLIATLMLMVTSLKMTAQSPYHAYSNDGVQLNFFEIDNVDFRLYLLYQLSQEDRFALIPEGENGQFVVTSVDDQPNNGFLDAFDAFYDNTLDGFSFLTKQDIIDLFPLWKSSVPPTAFTSIMLDISLSRATRENNHCVDSDPFCTSDVITFDAATSEQTANQLEGTTLEDGCIGSSYSPAWFHMRINTPGQFIIHMEGHDPTTNYDRDIDFCMWGPYDDPISPCVAQLTTDKIIDCNYSSSYSEDIYLGYPESEHHHQADHQTINEHMPEMGEYFILMITNYSRQPCTISFTKTEGSGPGTTDCGILPGIATNDGPYCTGETISLTVTTQAGATYSWTGPDGFTSNQQNPVLSDCTMAMAGTYTCVTTVDNQTTSGSTEVVIYATPEPEASATPASVQYGGVATITVDPGAEGNFSYHWEPADMVTDPDSQTTQTVQLIETQIYTVTVTNVDGDCVNSTELTVVMAGSNLTATAVVDDNDICEGEFTTLHALPAGGTGNYTYSWTPTTGLGNPSSQNPMVSLDAGSYTYTCHVSDGIIDQYPSVSFIVHPNGSDERILPPSCDEALMDWFGNTLTFTHDTVAILNGLTTHGCDSTMRVVVQDMQFTPNPASIRCNEDFYLRDGDIVAVITETEFFSFNYDFTVSEVGSSIWDECEWSISKESWRIEQSMSNDRRSSTCTVYVADRDEALVELNCKVRNDCLDEGEYRSFTIYLKSSYVGVDEHGDDANVSIIPNPNNGQMHLSFEQMEGKVNVKVFDMSGNQVDTFETIVNPDSYGFDYQMKTSAQGIYFFVISDSRRSITRKVVIIQ